MRYLYIVLFILLSVINAQSQTLSLMTYNIRLDISSDGENAWSKRKHFLGSQVLFYAPDILGVQEARPGQMDYLEEILIDYEVFGKGRDGRNEGEHASIFYNKNKLEVIQNGTFWLSETPNYPSIGWDAAYPRIFTYGQFKVLDSNTKFWVFNTHLDHKGSVARKQGIQLILNKIEKLMDQNEPVMLMGDFNVEPESELITLLKLRMEDSREKAKIVFGPEGTFNGFDYQKAVVRRIDYIMMSKGHKDMKVEKYAVPSSSADLKFPSDHFPVYVELNLN